MARSAGPAHDRRMSRRNREWSRRDALSALAVSLVGCGGSQGGAESPLADGGAGAGGTPGAGGASSGGSAGAGVAGQAGQLGHAGSGGLGCRLTGPTPGCRVTEDNILGPFYTPGAPLRGDITDGATGQGLILEGRVYGCDCETPLAGAEVDIWQADDGGAYDNAGYRLRGKLMTDADGRYEFRSILPGFYLNGATYRPRHVHYKVSHQDGTALTTQLYFEGDPYIPTDPFVRQSLVHPLVEEAGGIYRVRFDIVLG
jgi:catechol 1,2-dioxygenase